MSDGVGEVAGSVCKYTDSEIEISKLKGGDHIYIFGGRSRGAKSYMGKAAYYHHGIYLGASQRSGTFSTYEDMCVADFGRELDENSKQIKHPVETTIQKFMGVEDGDSKMKEIEKLTAKVFRREHHGKDVLTPVMTVFTCCKFITPGSEKAWVPYSLTHNNCEHFASMMKLGIMWSPQTEVLPEVLRKPTDLSDRVDVVTHKDSRKAVLDNKVHPALTVKY